MHRVELVAAGADAERAAQAFMPSPMQLALCRLRMIWYNEPLFRLAVWQLVVSLALRVVRRYVVRGRDL